MFHNFGLIPNMAWTNIFNVYFGTYKNILFLIFVLILLKVNFQSWIFYNKLLVNILNLSSIKLFIIT
jgi:hypothetical protein